MIEKCIFSGYLSNVKMQKMSIFFTCFLLSLLSSITHSRTYYDEDMVSNIIARGYRPYAASNRFPVEPRRAIRSGLSTNSMSVEAVRESIRR
uniref:Uncharacterized protein n=1 Tax=Ascaris lumbricoides TaxID=6252 RepID=A0A0M3HXG4_ASCLU